MFKHSSQQLASKLPKASTIAALGLSSTTLYVLYTVNAKKQSFTKQVQHTKDDFNRIKEESSERFKLAKEEFKCMPAVQEAQRLANAPKLKWNQGMEQLQVMKNDSSHQNDDTPTLEYMKSKEKEIESFKAVLEEILADEKFRELCIEEYGADSSLMHLERFRDSLDHFLVLLRMDKKEKGLGWSLELAAAWNDCGKEREKSYHFAKDLKLTMEQNIGTRTTDTQGA